MGGIRIYDVVVFGLVAPEPESIVKDTVEIVRRQTRRLFEEADRSGRTTRQAAMEMFAPDTFDTPDI
jgi:glutamate dehydrogenase (NAD(P)+)